jgi:hypothetical protein
MEEARFALDRQLVELAAENGGKAPLVSDIRFFLYPSSERRLVFACAERADGGADVQVLFEMPTPVVGDLDENAIREMFLDVPSGARH